MENGRRYDIVRAENEKNMIWLEGAADFDLAKSRVDQLISFWPGKYRIFDLQTKQVVLDTADALASEPPVSETSEFSFVPEVSQTPEVSSL